jgi:hypothetical protein
MNGKNFMVEYISSEGVLFSVVFVSKNSRFEFERYVFGDSKKLKALLVNKKR